MVNTEARLKAIELANENHPKAEVARMLNVTMQTAHQWIRDAGGKDAIRTEEEKRGCRMLPLIS